MGILCPVVLPASGVVTPRNTKFAQRPLASRSLAGRTLGRTITLPEPIGWVFCK
jgi:hypothetical protein